MRVAFQPPRAAEAAQEEAATAAIFSLEVVLVSLLRRIFAQKGLLLSLPTEKVESRPFI